MSYLQSDPNDLKVDQLCEALTQSYGFIQATQAYIAKKCNLHFTAVTIKKMIQKFGLVDYVNELRTKIVEDCYRKTYLKAVQEGDTNAMQWYLEKYGHHVDFLPEKVENSTNLNTFKEILERQKSIES